MTTKDDSYIENLTAVEVADKALCQTCWLGFAIGLSVGVVLVTAICFISHLLAGGCP